MKEVVQLKRRVQADTALRFHLMTNDLSSKTSLIAGGLAGLTSSVTLQPLDLLKTRLQQQNRHPGESNHTLTHELKQLKNYKELWRGVLPSCLRTSIGSGIYLTLLSQTRFYIYNLKQMTNAVNTHSSSILPRLSHFENLSIGFVVRGIAGYLTMPITVIKTRYESNLYNYNSLYEAIKRIYYDNGKLSMTHFFKGSVVTLSRDCPHAGLYVLFYEHFKTTLTKLAAFEQGVINSGLINSGAAVLAASLSTTITAPSDAIKTRMQLSTNRQSIVSATKALINEDGGIRNLFRGLSLRLSRKGLSAGISWCIYEELLTKFKTTSK